MEQPKKIEFISSSEQGVPTAAVEPKPPARLKIFLSVFFISLALGLIINYARPAVYQSSATLLTSAPVAIDQTSVDTADLQHVTIQQQKLLGFELLSATLELLKNQQGIDNLTLQDVRNMLSVKPVEQTNLLMLTATGPEPELLPKVVNTWINVYQDARAMNIQQSARQTIEQVQSELKELDEKISQKQQELNQFRQQHDISSIVREENEQTAALNALTQALNNAKEDEIKAKARLDAINQAIASGQTIVPEHEQRSLSNLEKRYQELKEKLAEFDKRYTRDYLALQPSLKFIPEQIKKLEKEIRRKRKVGQNSVWTEASQEYQAARQVTAKLRIQLDRAKKEAASFSTLFAKHEQLQEDLKSLEELYRDTQIRLTKIESSQIEQYPQVEVVEKASLNLQAISPDYTLGAGIALLSALVLAFFAVWLIEFLSQSSKPEQGFHSPIAVWFGQAPQQTEQIIDDASDKLIEKTNEQGLPFLQQEYKKIPDEELTILLKNSSPDTQLIILLLLSGLSADEISTLDINNFQLEDNTLHLADSDRTIAIGQRLAQRLQQAIEQGNLWEQPSQLSPDDINALLYCVFVDARISTQDTLPAEQIRQSYIIYLVEQGLRLTLLEKITSKLAPVELAGYARFSPEHKGLDIDMINPVHPCCR